MKIGINGNEANVSYRVGVGQYCFELLKHIKKSVDQLPRKQIEIVNYLSNNPMSDMPQNSSNWCNKILYGSGMWTLTNLQRELIRERFLGVAPNVFFTPTHYSPAFMPIPSVISIMDISFEKFPEYFKKRDLYQLKYWTWLSAMQTKKIITISEYSKKDICEVYKLPKDKVVVTYLGYDRERFHSKIGYQTSQIKNVKGKYKIKRDYLLFLGTLQPKKNLLRLIQAFIELNNPNIQLVVAGMINEGRGGWMNETIQEKIKNQRLVDNIVLTGYIPDDEVPYLMAGARAYVLPSLYEGFGIPPIEAMAVGTPVVVSKVASLPEICGKAALYIENPYEISSIKNALEKVISLTGNEKKKKTDFGLHWVTRYNWEKTAEKTLEILENAAK